MTALNMNLLDHKDTVTALPERAIQFGEGNFLRGFVDWMIHKLNQNGLFNGRVVVIQPIEQGLSEQLNQQDGLYTLLLRGIQNDKVVQEQEIISSISRVINPYKQYEDYLACAANPDLRFVFSNTTEAGIAYSPADRYEDKPPASFPGKLTVFLHKRFEAFQGDPDKGLVIIPCELIENNGDELRKIVLRLAAEWELGEAFIHWVEHHNHFLSSLVDRIVTGYPREEIDELTKQAGYEDACFTTAEIFHLWVIQGDQRFAEELPFTKVGLNVIWAEDMTPYRTRKVRILNGAHTMTALAAYLYGAETVKDCMDDPSLRQYMEKGIYDEIIPTLDLPEEELLDFAKAVLDRFANPYNKHYLLSISLNSVSKFKTRVLPSIKDYIKRKNELPKVLTFSMAALLAFYRGTELREQALIGKRASGVEYVEYDEYAVNDDLPVLELFQSVWSSWTDSREGTAQLVNTVLQRADLWGEDLTQLPGFAEQVADHLHAVITKGMQEALKDVI